MERKQVGAQLGPITDDETEEVELERRYKEQTDVKIKQEQTELRERNTELAQRQKGKETRRRDKLLGEREKTTGNRKGTNKPEFITKLET